MEAEKRLSPDESLALISDVIEKTKQSLRSNSFSFLLWGWLITIASLTFFVLKHFTKSEFYFVPFPLAVILGIAGTIWNSQHKKSGETQTYSDYFIGKLWFVLGLVFLLVVFINVSQGTQPFSYTMLIAGAGTLITGMVLGFKPLIIGGVLLLCSALVSIYISPDYKVLLQAFSIAGGYLIPGYLLKAAER